MVFFKQIYFELSAYPIILREMKNITITIKAIKQKYKQ